MEGEIFVRMRYYRRKRSWEINRRCELRGQEQVTHRTWLLWLMSQSFQGTLEQSWWLESDHGWGWGGGGWWSCPGKLWLSVAVALVALQRSLWWWAWRYCWWTGAGVQDAMRRWGQWGAGTSQGHLCLCGPPSLTTVPWESNEQVSSCSQSLYNLIFAYLNAEL